MKKIFAKLVRVDKDKKGKPIPIYRLNRVTQAKGVEDVYNGKKKVPIIKL